jgi:hypothetical protein
MPATLARFVAGLGTSAVSSGAGLSTSTSVAAYLPVSPPTCEFDLGNEGWLEPVHARLFPGGVLSAERINIREAPCHRHRGNAASLGKGCFVSVVDDVGVEIHREGVDSAEKSG